MPTDTEVEEKMRRLEAEVRATRAASPPPPREAAPLAHIPKPSAVLTPALPESKPGFFTRLWRKQTWKTKLVVIGGTILAGAVTIWFATKLIKLAFYVGVAAAVAYGVWWLVRKKKA